MRELLTTGALPARARAGISRRAVLGRMSAGAAVGTTAWVIPQILTAKPAAGATMSGSPATLGRHVGRHRHAATSSQTTGSTSAGGVPSTLSSLAQTGLDLERDAEIGATMIAVGWALHRWASRGPAGGDERSRRRGQGGKPGAAPPDHVGTPRLPLGLPHAHLERALVPLRGPLRRRAVGTVCPVVPRGPARVGSRATAPVEHWYSLTVSGRGSHRCRPRRRAPGARAAARRRGRMARVGHQPCGSARGARPPALPRRGPPRW